MKQHLIIIIALFVLISSCGFKNLNNELSPKAIVTSDEAKIILPITQKAEYHWNKPGIPDGVFEYDFMIYISKYQAGVTYFKNSSKNEKTGTIQQLIDESLVGIWESDGFMATPLLGHRIQINYSQKKSVLTISITDPSTIELLFSGRPNKCMFTSVGFVSKATKGHLKIEYE